MRDVFGSYHPVINFIYFGIVMVFGMLFLHPILLAISVTAAFCYSILLNGKSALKFNVLFLLPMILGIAAINPLINHRGRTLLFYLLDNPITLESVLYGVATGFMFAGIILWFSCYNAIMTSDKFVYLFGKLIPAMSLVFSMVLRFVPKFKAQVKVISDAQKCVGRDVGSGTVKEKALHGMKILSVMVTWALENAVDTADSMKARGYGLPGRSTFSIFRFDSRDKALASVLGILTLLLTVAAALGLCKAEFFPQIAFAPFSGQGLVVYTCYAILCFLPVILNGREEWKWRRLQSKI